MPKLSQSTIDEHALLAGIINGDVGAFEAFYRLYHPRLTRFIERTTRQSDYVDEVIQETLLLVWQQPERYNRTSKISTWVFGIAYHKALKLMSKNSRRIDDEDVTLLSETLSASQVNQAEQTETQNWIDCAMQQLSAEQRAVIELTFHHGLSYQDIAGILDCPENTVKTRMFHARKKLQAFAKAQEG